VKPQAITQLDQAFPTNVTHLMPLNEPDYPSYRERYLRDETSWGWKLFRDWFYFGVSELRLTPKNGIDGPEAVAHIRTIMGSWEPKHEDKTASCAYLFEHWFESATWKKEEKKEPA